MIGDPPDPPKRSVDPDDDYLLALIDAANVNYLVSGDPHLTGRPRAKPVDAQWTFRRIRTAVELVRIPCKTR
jgi:predicted nucleic acid-binding protein